MSIMAIFKDAFMVGLQPSFHTLLKVCSTHKILYQRLQKNQNNLKQSTESALTTQLADRDATVGQKQIQGLFKDFYQFWPNSRTFKALKTN